ncbi:MAG TPA: EF-hand domain-containing protein [Verrucomicrobiae bacterium]|jgi:hypothetical protein|nr:EF-hand domain-containing protein [Verrucomicrobiae bacterium]
MKKFLALSLVCLAAVLSVHAQKATTDEQKAFKKEMMDKYDADKNGKLDKDEKAKMTDDEKAKWKKLFPAHHKKADSDTGSSTNSVPKTN